MASAEKIELLVKNPDGYCQGFKIKKDTPLKTLFQAYCTMFGLEVSDVEFVAHAMLLAPDDTSQRLELKRGDTISAVTKRASGSSKRTLEDDSQKLPATAGVQERAWKMRKFTDAEILVEGERFPVHRSTLCAASPVFDAGFSCDMEEGRTSVYEIKNASPAAVDAMLRFIYTGCLECSAQELPCLLELAVQYELSELRSILPGHFLNDVTQDNVRERGAVLKRLSDSNLHVRRAFGKLLEIIQSDTRLISSLL
eukprot:TRINITY_DN57140_c0_g1_i1.p1 TRINITY_DN57140_c0_g1~~TRINITY_DN57140_c0_g1_i1.p1  ORF type:complete len:254 (-),score=46.97 TRINITY_DN57140_c0_g1_i1:86-847(-)